MYQFAWQKSSFSGAGQDNACVEMAAAGAAIAVRESEEPGTVITTEPGSLAALIRAAKAGRLSPAPAHA